MLRYFIAICLLILVNAYDPVPKPIILFRGSKVYNVDENIKIVNPYPQCNLLTDAIKRFTKYLYNQIYIDYKGQVNETIDTIYITMVKNDTDDENAKLWPTENMDESYQIEINYKGIIILSKEVWGILRALQTIFQMAYRINSGALCINETILYDKPRFKFRGLMLDTSRHFLPVQTILDNLELMSISKLNVFHWHIVDDESFPYQSKTFPDLSDKGSFHRYSHVYTQRDVLRILDFARRRGIRVIPEFDSPGHSLSWGKSQKNLLTPCYSGSKPSGFYGPIDPTLEGTYTFLTKLFKEIIEIFPDNFIHLGGDEVNFDCWKSNPRIVNFTVKNGFPNDFYKLQGFYMVKLIDLVQKLAVKKKNFKTMVWQEVFDYKNQVDRQSSIINVWKGENNWQKEMAQVTNANYTAVLSSCWYLNYISYGIDWHKHYTCDPQNFDGKKDLVIGGEACMWGEYVDATNVIPRTWPRASVVAERLWSNKSVTDLDDMANRLHEFRCRLVINGFNAETMNGGGTYCNIPGKI